jgi:hypothetical protein
MLPLLLRHEIQVLRRAGHSQADTAKRAGVSVDAVRRIEREVAVASADDPAERRARGIGRPSKAAPFGEKIRTWLTEDPALPTLELLRRGRDAGYAGHKTAFYALVAGLRPLRVTPVVRFEGLPAEFSQHDFGHVDVRFVEGRKKRVHFFASRLKYSRFVAVTLVDNERVETLVRNELSRRARDGTTGLRRGAGSGEGSAPRLERRLPRELPGQVAGPEFAEERNMVDSTRQELYSATIRWRRVTRKFTHAQWQLFSLYGRCRAERLDGHHSDCTGIGVRRRTKFRGRQRG